MLRNVLAAQRAAGSSAVRLLSRGMAVFSSKSVRSWIGKQAVESPSTWLRWKNPETHKWKSPLLSRRKQALLVKEAIRRGEVQLEPTVMVPPPKFKGHKREHLAPEARASIAAKMAKMPEMIAAYREQRREKRAKIKAANRWK